MDFVSYIFPNGLHAFLSTRADFYFFLKWYTPIPILEKTKFIGIHLTVFHIAYTRVGGKGINRSRPMNLPHEAAHMLSSY